MTDPATHPALSLRNLQFAYAPAQTPLINIPSLDLAKGEQLLLTGGSGRGKSTLLQLIAGLLDPSEGHVLVDNIRIHSMQGAARDLYRGRTIGMIFQTFNLLHGFSALENVMIALMFSSLPRHQHQKRAEGLLHRLGIERTGAKPEELSVGQQQRVAVARALAGSPVLVLADEPTASLDPENAASAMDLIQSACKEQGAALLCTSHDPAMRERFPRRLALQDLNSDPQPLRLADSGPGDVGRRGN